MWIKFPRMHRNGSRFSGGGNPYLSPILPRFTGGGIISLPNTTQEMFFTQ